MNAVDAVAKMARDYPGGVAAVCARLGWNPNIVRLKLCQTEARHHLTLAEVEAIQAVCDAPDLVIALAESLNLDVCFASATPAPGAGCNALDAIQGLARVNAEFGDYARVLAEAMADGVISENERKALNREMTEAITALFRLHGIVTRDGK